MTEDEMAGWHHRLNGHEFEQAPGIVENRGAWRAAVHGVTKIREDLATEQKQQQQELGVRSPEKGGWFTEHSTLEFKNKYFNGKHGYSKNKQNGSCKPLTGAGSYLGWWSPPYSDPF